MKKLGIIGGLGPMATAYFLELITQMSDAITDQGHMEIYVISKPSIPDRTNYILGLSNQSPAVEMAAAGTELKSLGAELLAMPCVTGHYFYQEIERNVGLPMINVVKETVDYLWNRNIKRAGILATEGTIKSGLFQGLMKEKKMKCIVPDEAEQKKMMDIIYKELKAGKEVQMDNFEMMAEKLRQQGAEVILLACTELSLLKRDYEIGKGYLDVMEVLAAKAVDICNHLKPEYRELIT